MKRWAVFLLVLQVATINIVDGGILHHAARLYYLVEHFGDHRSEDRSMGFMDFLHLHYSAEHAADNDQAEDARLPFKTTGHGTFCSPIIGEVTNEDWELFCASCVAPNYRVSGDRLVLSSIQQGVWNPPRFS